MPLITMPDGVTVNFPDDMSKNEIASTIMGKFPELDLPLDGNEFTRGVARGVDTTTALVTEGVPAVAKGLVNDLAEVFGAEPITDPTENLQRYQDKVQDAYAKNPTAVPTYKDIEGIGDFGKFVASTVGEQIPQIGGALVGGGVGGIGAKIGVQQLAKRGGKELLEGQAEKALQRGLLAGTTTVGASQNIPETYFNLLEKGEDAATTAVLIGSLKTGLDNVFEVGLLKNMLGSDAVDILGDTLLKRAGIAGLRGAATEGVTEGAQEGLDIIAENFIIENEQLFTQENLERLIDSSLKGAVGGGAFGAASSPIISKEVGFDYESLSPKKKQQLDTKFATEVIGEVTPDVKQENLIASATNPLSDTIISPSYLPDETNFRMESFGISSESANNLSPKGVEYGTLSIEQSDTATSLDTAYTSPLFAQMDPSLVTSIEERNKLVLDGERKDTEFILGDGEIVTGAPINPEETLRNPTSVLGVNNIFNLEKNALPKIDNPKIKKAKKDAVVLPRGLSQNKPKFNGKPLNFPSDVEKAIYLGAPKSKNKRAKEYRSWLKEYANLSNGEIKQMGDALTDQVKRAKEVNKIEVNSLDNFSTDTLQLPIRKNVRDGLILPKVLYNRLRNAPMDSQGRNTLMESSNTLESILTPLSNGSSHFQKYLYESDIHNDPITSYKTFSILEGAHNPDKDTLQEAYIALETSGLFTEEITKKLDKATEKLVDFIGDDFEATPFMTSPVGRRELRAVAFAEAALDSTRKVPTGFVSSFDKSKKALAMTKKRTKALADTTQDSELYSDVSFDTRTARQQEIAERYQEALAFDKLDVDVGALVKEARVQQNINTKGEGTGPLWQPALNGYGRFIRSMYDSAHQHPFMAQILDSVQRRDQQYNVYLTDYQKASKDFFKQPVAVRNKLHDLAATLMVDGQKGTINQNGFLEFQKDGQIVQLKDQELSQQYMNMQAGYRKVLADNLELVKKITYSNYKNDLPSENFTTKDIEVAISVMNPEVDQKKIQTFKDVAENLRNAEHSASRDYVPRMRFGSHGVTVRDTKTDEQVNFTTFEKNSRGGFDKTGLAKFEEEAAAEGYFTNPRYKVFDANGEVTSFANMDPFLLTKSTMANKLIVDSSILNVELLGGILNSENVDEAAYGELRNEIFTDITTRGFSNRFKKADNISGYSTDWTRAHHAYLTSAAHYLSGIPHNTELASLKTEADKLESVPLKDKAVKYLDYNNSPSEDFVKLRAFNFLWTMGGNISTSLLQIVTLPTTSLGGMAEYSPNSVANMKRISKWFKLGLEDITPTLKTSIMTEEGLLDSHFGNKELLGELVDSGKINNQHKKFIGILNDVGKLRGGPTEDMSGGSQFETSTKAGGFRKNLGTAANLLGTPVALMEQHTRFATAVAMFDLMISDPKALARARKQLENNQLFQATVKNSPQYSFEEHVALYSMDKAHGVYNKLGRPDYMRGIGGALIVPFMTFPHYALENMARMYGNGPDGRRAFYTTLGAMGLLGGLMGLPGVELIKELLEALTPEEDDLEQIVREKIYNVTGDHVFAKFITQGIGRAFFGLDVSKRMGLPIPGQEILFNVTGVRGDSSDMLGVSGSLLGSIGQAWSDYHTDASPISVLSSLTPVAAANILKATSMGSSGVSTNRGVQLVTPEEITAQSRIARALGFTSDQIASKREELYYTQILEKKYRPVINRFRERAKKAWTSQERALDNGDEQKARLYAEKYQGIIEEYVAYAEKEEIDPKLGTFNKSVIKAVKQRTDTTIRPKDVAKSARRDLENLQRSLGTYKE